VLDKSALVRVKNNQEGEEVMQHSATHPSDSAERPQGVAPPLAHELSWAALLLAWAAAFSDAIGFLVLQQLGVSFMSGNSMAMGVALGRLEWASVPQRGLPIPPSSLETCWAFSCSRRFGAGVSALPLPSSLAWKRCVCLLFCCWAPTRCRVVLFLLPGYFICASCC
jgi:uncharacterized membrane protein YoaK (UPF0700 family)